MDKRTYLDDERLGYSPGEAAVLLGIDRSTIYKLMRAGKLGSVKIGSRRVIPRAALLALLEPVEPLPEHKASS